MEWFPIEKKRKIETNWNLISAPSSIFNYLLLIILNYNTSINNTVIIENKWKKILNRRQLNLKNLKKLSNTTNYFKNLNKRLLSA